MPLAENFASLTRGDALPFCPAEIVPAEGETYITRDARDTQVRAFWLAHSIRAQWSWSAVYIGEDEDQDPRSLTADVDVTSIVGATGGVGALAPKDRVCLTSIEGETVAGARGYFFWRVDDIGKLGSGFTFRFTVELELASNEVNSVGLFLTSYQLPAGWTLLGTYSVSLPEWTTIGSPVTLYAYAFDGFLSKWAFTLGSLGFTLDEWFFA